jgi:hypothetical protein
MTKRAQFTQSSWLLRQSAMPPEEIFPIKTSVLTDGTAHLGGSGFDGGHEMRSGYRITQAHRVTGLALISLGLLALPGCGRQARDGPHRPLFQAMIPSMPDTVRNTTDTATVAGDRSLRGFATSGRPIEASSHALSAATGESQVAGQDALSGTEPDSKTLSFAADRNRDPSSTPTATPSIAPRSFTRTASALVAGSDKRFEPRHGVAQAVWWDAQVGRALRDPSRAVYINPERLAFEALAHSEHIKALRTVPPSVARDI